MKKLILSTLVLLFTSQLAFAESCVQAVTANGGINVEPFNLCSSGTIVAVAKGQSTASFEVSVLTSGTVALSNQFLSVANQEGMTVTKITNHAQSGVPCPIGGADKTCNNQMFTATVTSANGQDATLTLQNVDPVALPVRTYQVLVNPLGGAVKP